MAAIITSHQAVTSCVAKNRCEKADFTALREEQLALGRGLREVYSSQLDGAAKAKRVAVLTAEYTRINGLIQKYEGALDIYKCTLQKCKAQHAAGQKALVDVLEATGNTKMVKALGVAARKGSAITSAEYDVLRAQLRGV